jgi:hypothetical protein
VLRWRYRPISTRLDRLIEHATASPLCGLMEHQLLTGLLCWGWPSNRCTSSDASTFVDLKVRLFPWMDPPRELARDDVFLRRRVRLNPHRRCA